MTGAEPTAWSPDGRRLVFGNRGDLYVHDVKSGVTTNVTHTPRRWELLPAWSPDSTQLAFTSRAPLPGEGPPTAGAFDWTMNGVFGGAPTIAGLDGTGYRVLDEVTISSAPSWSRDGDTLAYAVGGVLRLVDVASGAARSLTPGELGLDARLVAAPAWSPTRDELAVFFATAEEQGYAVVDPDDASATVVHEYSAPSVLRGPALWSSEGNHLALVFRQEARVADPVELTVVDREGHVELRQPGLFSGLAWDPGAPRFAVRSDDEPGTVVVVTFDGGSPSVEKLAFDGEVAGVGWRAG